MQGLILLVIVVLKNIAFFLNFLLYINFILL